MFFFNDTATTEIYTLSLHDALPISPSWAAVPSASAAGTQPEPRTTATSWRSTPVSSARRAAAAAASGTGGRSEEHTSELQSRQYIVCRPLLEKKKTNSLLCSLTSYI